MSALFGCQKEGVARLDVEEVVPVVAVSDDAVHTFAVAGVGIPLVILDIGCCILGSPQMAVVDDKLLHQLVECLALDAFLLCQPRLAGIIGHEESAEVGDILHLFRLTIAHHSAAGQGLHVVEAVVEQLYPFLELSHIGLVGHDASGFAILVGEGALAVESVGDLVGIDAGIGKRLYGEAVFTDKRFFEECRVDGYTVDGLLVFGIDKEGGEVV